MLLFQQKWGHLPSIYGDTKEERLLGAWLITQRTRRKGARNKRELTSVEIRLLESLSGWQWDPNASAWRKQYEAFLGFVQREGRHPRAAGTDYVTGQEEEDLAAWGSRQRSSIKGKARKGGLSSDEISALNEIPGWSWDPLNANWQDKYGQVQEYLAANNNIYPTQADNKPLNTWCQKQRRRKREGTLEPTRIAQLERLPRWDWNPPQISRAKSVE